MQEAADISGHRRQCCRHYFRIATTLPLLCHSLMLRESIYYHYCQWRGCVAFFHYAASAKRKYRTRAYRFRHEVLILLLGVILRC